MVSTGAPSPLPVIDETRDRALGSDRPPVLIIQNGDGIQIERADRLPVSALVNAYIFSIRTDSNESGLVESRDGRAKASRSAAPPALQVLPRSSDVAATAEALLTS